MTTYLKKYLNLMQSNIALSIPISMLFGIIFGIIFPVTQLKILILPLTFLMVYPMMVNLKINQLFTIGDNLLQITAIAINFLIIPFIAFFIGKIFFINESLISLGLLLTALLPTSGMTISWTGFAKGNIEAAVKMTIIGLITGSIATPFYAKWLMGATIDIPLLKIFSQIIIVVFLPMLAGYFTRILIIKKYGNENYEKNIKNHFPPISTLGVIGIVFTAMALKASTIIKNPLFLLKLIFPLIILYGINFLISTIIGRLFFKPKDAIALVYGTVMRNLSIALAIAMNVFGTKGADIALIIALGYIIQVQSAAWYLKFTKKLFYSNQN